MTRLYTNNFSTVLDGNITNVATSIDVVDAAGLPAVGSGDTCRLTIDDGTNIEIVEVTGVSSNTLTVVRAQEGTTGTAFSDGANVELRSTAASYIDPADLRLPTSATPSLDTDGQIALDTTVADFSHGIIKYYGDEELAVIAVPVAQLTSPTDGYVIAYDATNDEFVLAEVNVTPANSAFSAISTAFQSIATGTPTKVTFGTEVFDTAGDYDATTNYRFTPSIAGYYLINAFVGVVALQDGASVILELRKNNSVIMQGSAVSPGAGTPLASVSTIVSMNGTTDYLEVFLNHDHGSNRTLNTTYSNWNGAKIA